MQSQRARPNGHISRTPIPKAEGTLWKRGWKDGKSQRMKDFAETTKSPQHGCQSKSNNGHATERERPPGLNPIQKASKDC